MNEVWVAETWRLYGEDRCVRGLYDSREAAFEALRALPNMTVYTDGHGQVRGRPRKVHEPGTFVRGGVQWVPEEWAIAHPMRVQGRARPQGPVPPLAEDTMNPTDADPDVVMHDSTAPAPPG